MHRVVPVAKELEEEVKYRRYVKYTRRNGMYKGAKDVIDGSTKSFDVLEGM